VAVRHAGDGLVYVRQPASKSTGFAGVQRGQRPPFESAFSPDSAAGSSDAMQRSDGAWTPGFSPKQQQQAGFVGAQQGPAATAAANAAATELLLQHMLANGRKRRRLLSRRWQVAVQRVQQHLHASQRPAPQPGHQQQLLPPLAMHSRQQPQQQPQQQPHQVLPVPDSMSHLHRPDALQRRQQQRTLSYVIGADNRREFAGSSRAWPLSAVGHLLYAKGSCTGVMIGPDTVLTAAHCVYSRQRSAWQGGMTFVPHRHRGDGGATLEPFGRVPVESVTTYSGW
jgi:V8-like Glu-specific endopeptidase